MSRAPFLLASVLPEVDFLKVDYKCSHESEDEEENDDFNIDNQQEYEGEESDEGDEDDDIFFERDITQDNESEEEEEEEEEENLCVCEDTESAVFALIRHQEYNIIRRIDGKQCLIYEALTKENNSVVLKVSAREDKKDKPDPIELRIMSKLDYVSCPKALKFYRFPTATVLVMDKFANDHVCEYLWGDPGRIKLYMLKLTKTIEYLHSLGIIYRDLKTSNVLWDDANKQLKLIDYDVATFKRSNLDSDRGTDGFQAPEVFFGDIYDEKVDVFGLGMVFGQLIFKTHEEEVENGITIKQWKRHMRSIDDPPPALKLLNKLLQTDPKSRPTIAEILNDFYFSS